MTVIMHRATVLDTVRSVVAKTILKVVPGFSSGPEARPAYDKFLFGVSAPAGVAYEPATVGNVVGWWCVPPEARDDATILYLHGGAYVLGTAAAYRHFVGHVAAACQMRAFVPDYGLAPERPFPAALDDAMAAYRAMVAAGRPVALVGDSAGGGLCLALLLNILAAGGQEALVQPFGIAVFSPWTDLALTGESMSARARHDPLLSHDVLRGSADLYLNGHDARDPLASPVFGQFTECPPTLIHVGTDEVLLDDSLRVEKRLAEPGHMVEAHVWCRMTHVFLTDLKLDASRKALAICAEFLRRTHHDQKSRFDPIGQCVHSRGNIACSAAADDLLRSLPLHRLIASKSI